MKITFRKDYNVRTEMFELVVIKSADFDLREYLVRPQDREKKVRLTHAEMGPDGQSYRTRALVDVWSSRVKWVLTKHMCDQPSMRRLQVVLGQTKRRHKFLFRTMNSLVQSADEMIMGFKGLCLTHINSQFPQEYSFGYKLVDKTHSGKPKIIYPKIDGEFEICTNEHYVINPAMTKGKRVQVLRGLGKDKEGGWIGSWEPIMGRAIGRIMVVQNKDNEEGVLLEDGFHYPNYVLRIV